jgi:tetratricopeptide (TPR) repeat protein
LKRISAFVFLVLLLSPFCVQAQTGLLDRANELIRQGQAKSALELLLPASAGFAADARYHYFLGIAYFDDGQAEKAIAEYHEALRLNPDLFQAEAELGRAYLLTGDFLAAHTSFDRVRAGNPPPEVLASIATYVERIHTQAESQRQRFRGSLTLGLGYDSNVNTATSAQQVTLPILGGIVATLSPAGRARSDSFHMFGIEASGFVQLDGATEAFGSGAINGKLNHTVDTFDARSDSFAAGIRHTFGENQVALSASVDSITLDNLRVRDSNGLNLEFRRIVHPLAEVSAFAQLSRLDYPRDPFRDADREVYGVAVNPVAFGKRLFNLPPVASVYWGSERPTAAGVGHLGHSLSGIRFAAFAQFDPRLSLFAGLSHERRLYGAPDPLFAVTRLDKQTDLSAGLIYGLNKDWSFTPVISYTDTRSSLDVFKYQRTAVTATLRYQF